MATSLALLFALAMIVTVAGLVRQRLQRAHAAARAAEAKQQRLEERIRHLLQAANDAFVSVDDRDTILEWSHLAERMFGWARDEVVGRKLTLIPAPSAAPDPDGIQQLLEVADGRLVVNRVEASGLHRDGRVFPIELSIFEESRDGGHVVRGAFVRDMGGTGQHSPSCRVGSIVVSSEDAMMGESLDGIILTWNLGAERIFGYRAAEVVGLPSSVIVAPDHQAEAADLVDRCRRGESLAGHETVRLRRDGSRIEVAVTVSPIRDHAGEVIGVSTVARDITEQKRMAEALEAALTDSRESEVRSRAFLADAAHQLRTPIAGIRTCAETLLRGASAADRDRLLTDVVVETSRAGRLMASLLQMARLDRGEALTPEPCDLAALCEDEVERARRLARPDLEMTVSAASLEAERPALDTNAIREIVGNLLDNARRHAGQRISVEAGISHDQIELRVADDGPGLPGDKVERAFERFASLDGQGGSGLGLPIARGLARAHGGDLSWEDGRFVLRLPVRTQRRDTDGASPAEQLPLHPT